MFNPLDGLTDEEEILVKTKATTDNWFSFDEFYKKVVDENPQFKNFVEVGAWKGHSVSSLANRLVKRGGEFDLYAVDYWNKLPKDKELWGEYADQIPLIYNIYNYNLHKAKVRGHVFDLFGDSAESAKFFDDRSLDFVFIDASHDFDSVRADISAWKPKIRSNGIIAGHDYHNGGVRPAVELNFDFVNVLEKCDVWYTRIK